MPLLAVDVPTDVLLWAVGSLIGFAAWMSFMAYQLGMLRSAIEGRLADHEKRLDALESRAAA